MGGTTHALTRTWTIIRARLQKIFGGRYSRGAWLLATLGYATAIALVILPPATFLSTSPKPLQNLYWPFASGIALASALGVLITYGKRLGDQGLKPIWALVVLIALPWALLSITGGWISHLAKNDPLVDSSAYYGFAMAAWLIVVLLVGLRRSRGEIYQHRVTAADVFQVRSSPAFLLIAVAGVLVPLSLYAGLMQPGLWVGREQFSYFSGPVITVPGGGHAFATCGNARGVSAAAQSNVESGFFRDAINGTWSVVFLPDGTLDIQTFNERQVLSYREDGFDVRAKGLEFGRYQAVAADVDHFQVIAESATAASDNITVLSFVKRELGYYVLITASRIVPKGELLARDAPRTSTYLMMADCTVSQEQASQ